MASARAAQWNRRGTGAAVAPGCILVAFARILSQNRVMKPAPPLQSDHRSP
jgi:hypothetical protein